MNEIQVWFLLPLFPYRYQQKTKTCYVLFWYIFIIFFYIAFIKIQRLLSLFDYFYLLPLSKISTFPITRNSVAFPGCSDFTYKSDFFTLLIKFIEFWPVFRKFSTFTKKKQQEILRLFQVVQILLTSYICRQIPYLSFNSYFFPLWSTMVLSSVTVRINYVHPDKPG